jgi:hypothetical protein
MKRTIALVLLAIPRVAWAADGGAPDAAPIGPEPRATSTRGCVEHLPAGKARPSFTETFPDKGLAGHAAVLEVVVEHGKGESVLPHGLRLQVGGDEADELERSGFALPDPDGGAGPSLETKQEGERAKTTVRIPVVPLPDKPGLHQMTLPPLPIAISRASGDVVTVCTRPHPISVDEPIADAPDAKPKDNPPPRRQLEEWTTLKHVTYATLLALVVGALAAWLLGRWMRREKPKPPPPPPRPPWEVALEELEDVRRAELVENGRYAEHFDRVSYIVRKYCGDRYGFDGLESTTREMLSVLRRVVPPIAVLDVIEAFLRQADLVKFARLTPTAEECIEALGRGETTVRRTIPEPILAPPPASRAGPRPSAGPPPPAGPPPEAGAP